MQRFAKLLPVICSLLNISIAAPARAILIDGPALDGSDWRRQTAALKSILESNGLFQVEIVTASGEFEAAFEKYKLVILNYGADRWPMNTLASLEKYLTSGGGMVALPGADSAFPGWPEFNVMLGVTAGSNRDQRAGPFWFYKDGNVAYDTTAPGVAGRAIPPDKPFLVTIRNTEHPVTKGLPLEWMHVADELEGNLRGPGKGMTLLATAFSDATKGGTGRHEPQIVAIFYGKGRIFHSILGRTPEALECAGLQTMLQRGAEWAATGKVTQKVPADFPDEEKVSRRTRR
jgi:type 1 glutamine amidotransferase